MSLNNWHHQLLLHYPPVTAPINPVTRATGPWFDKALRKASIDQTPIAALVIATVTINPRTTVSAAVVRVAVFILSAFATD